MNEFNSLDTIVTEYRNDGLQPLPQYLQEIQRVACSYDVRQVLGEKQVCDVPIDGFYPCTLNDNFQSTSPCLFFKLSKVDYCIIVSLCLFSYHCVLRQDDDHVICNRVDIVLDEKIVKPGSSARLRATLAVD